VYVLVLRILAGKDRAPSILPEGLEIAAVIDNLHVLVNAISLLSATASATIFCATRKDAVFLHTYPIGLTPQFEMQLCFESVYAVMIDSLRNPPGDEA